MSTLGIIHTLIGIVAVIAGIIALIRDRRITAKNLTGQVYIHSTVLTCLTGFGIFHLGGFGAPHVLGIITLLVLGAAALAEHKKSFGAKSPYIEVIGYTTTLFFHFIPGITETFTRIPFGAPLFASRESPALAGTIGVIFVIFLVIMVAQVRALRRNQRSL
ncbi:MAG TPA: hypothetical protein VLE43_13080 [Candidatus Saccharimonadia bacterium]|nr:hypothetical protein [Candidatus Saccharimonadia bacterium]